VQEWITWLLAHSATYDSSQLRALQSPNPADAEARSPRSLWSSSTDLANARGSGQ
jgi:hypothetical protein